MKGGNGGFLRGVMAAALDLSDAQKGQIRSILEGTRSANRAIRDQLRGIREQEVAAVKAGRSEAELQALASSAAPLMTQLHAAHLVAQSRIYQVLTPEQREKLEKIRSEVRGRTGRSRQGRRGNF
jgi:Spy/CpxP family protein refolding chaperone